MKKILVFILIWMLMPCLAFSQTPPTQKSLRRDKPHKMHVKKYRHRKKTLSHSVRKLPRSSVNPKHLAATEESVNSNNQLTMALPGNPHVPVNSNTGLVASFKQQLVQFVHKTVSSINYSHYKMGGRKFDTNKGVYILDCSDYVDNILHTVSPRAYFSLVNSSGTDKPTSQHYYEFFNGLASSSDYFWNKIDDVDELEPGDILVFRTKRGARGHVMIVMNKPIADDDTYIVRVADSAPVGHSQDTRQANASGIGIGTLLLKANSVTGRPEAYAWKVGSRWTSNVTFAMARPMGTY